MVSQHLQQMEVSKVAEGPLINSSKLIGAQVKELQIGHLLEHLSFKVPHSVPLDVPVFCCFHTSKRHFKDKNKMKNKSQQVSRK